MDSRRVIDANLPATSVYTRLADVNEIRLLHLQPGGAEDPILCQLLHANILNYPQYEALSYMWGSKSSPQQIQLNGTMFEVRNNLWQALYHLRRIDSTRILWIDALCIKQDDVNERNHQVSQMGKIYKKASCVVACLGISDPSSRMAIQYFNKFQHNIPQRTKHVLQRTEFCSLDRKISIPDEVVDAIINFCSREYWSRLWIIQELVIASRITILCGLSVCDWSKCSFFIKYLEHQENRTGMILLRWEQLRNSVPTKIVYQRVSITQKPLFDLCIDYAASDCEQRHDKVFGLQAFTLNCCRAAVPIDYGSSLLVVSNRLVGHYLSKHKNGCAPIEHIEELNRILGITQQDLDKPASPMPPPLEKETALQDLTTCVRTSIIGRVVFTNEMNETSRRGTIRWNLRRWNTFFPHEIPSHHETCSHFKKWKGDLRQAYKLKSVLPLRAEALTVIKQGVWPPDQSHFQTVSSWINEKIFRTHMRLRGWRYFGRVLKFAKTAVRKAGVDKCSLVIDETGRILFAPMGTRAGDLICHVSGNILLVVRIGPDSETESWHCLGRALEFFDTLQAQNSEIVCLCRKTRPLYLSLGWIDVLVTLPTLQRMTVASEAPTVDDISNATNENLVVRGSRHFLDSAPFPKDFHLQKGRQGCPSRSQTRVRSCRVRAIT